MVISEDWPGSEPVGPVWSAELLRLEPSTNRRKQGSKPRTLSWIFFPPPTAAETPEAVLRPQKKVLPTSPDPVLLPAAGLGDSLEAPRH